MMKDGCCLGVRSLTLTVMRRRASPLKMKVFAVTFTLTDPGRIEFVSVLVGDIGGTKTVLALAREVEGRWRLDRELRLPSSAYDALPELVAHYLRETGASPRGAAFAVAGPVQDGRSDITNLPWVIDRRQLAGEFGWERVGLLNDLEAIAWGIPFLGPEDLETLYAGEEGAAGNACIIAAGTGLGQAGLYWDGERHHPFATEGGHADFAPASSREEALLAWLRRRHGHVSWERLVSGPGILNLYDFLRDQPGARSGGHATSSVRRLAGLTEAEGEDPVVAIAEQAAAGTCPRCVETMALFFNLYGREAGNLALKHLALGGVYLGGGIVPKNLELLRCSDFLAGFFAKGRLEPLLRRIPVKVILNPATPLLGAAHFFQVAPA